MSAYPQHDKLQALNGANNTVADFIRWMQQHGYVICEPIEPGRFNDWQSHTPTMKTTANLIAEFFGIDQAEYYREKDMIFHDLQLSQRRVAS